jgi:fused
MIIDVLNILSYLARISQDYYEPIHQINIYDDLAALIQYHKEPSTPPPLTPAIQAKVCNLIGNLCRHSDYFYQSLLQNKLIDLAI